MDENEIADCVNHGEFLMALGRSVLHAAEARQLLREEPYYAECTISDKLEWISLAHGALIKARKKLATAMEMLNDIKTIPNVTGNDWSVDLANSIHGTPTPAPFNIPWVSGLTSSIRRALPPRTSSPSSRRNTTTRSND